MPAKDKYHDVVVTALEKDGWVVNEQIVLYIGDRNVWVDLEARRSLDSIAILIEIKGFEKMPSPLEYLAKVAGQYMLYQSILAWNKTPIPLYLAVPTEAYKGILSEEIGLAVIQTTHMKLLVFDIANEEIVQWIE